VKKYADLHLEMTRAFEAYIQDVEAGEFPEQRHYFSMPDEAWEALLRELGMEV